MDLDLLFGAHLNNTTNLSSSNSNVKLTIMMQEKCQEEGTLGTLPPNTVINASTETKATYWGICLGQG